MLASRRVWLWCIPIFLFAFWLMLRLIPLTHMHHDEQLVYHFTRFDLAYTVWYQGNQDVHPPLWFSFFWLWRQFVGTAEFSGRLQAILFSLITLAFVWRIGRDWFGRARMGLLSMMALGLNGYFLQYALEIRPYALSMLLAAVSSWVLWRWLKTGERRMGLLYGALVAVMFYVHYFLAFLVAMHLVFGLIYIVTRRALQSRKVLVFQAVSAALVAFVLWLPWLPTFLLQNATLRRLAAEAGNAYGAGIGTPVTTRFTNLQTIADLVVLSTNGQVAIYALVLLAGAIYGWRRKAYWLVLLWAFGAPALSLLVNLVAAVYNPRYVAYLTVGLALALGVGLASLALPLGAGMKRIGGLAQTSLLLRTLGMLIVLTFFGLSLLALPGTVPVRIPYRDIFRQMSAQAEPGDVVYFRQGGEGDNLVQWNMDAYLSPTFSVISDYDLAEAERARRVWFLTGDLFDERVKSDFAALEPSHPVQTVIGQCDRRWCYVAQLMEAPPLSEPVVFADSDTGDALAFYGADIDRVDAAQIDTRLWWRVEQPLARDYSFGLHLLDTSGNLVAQNDGPVQHYGAETVQTSTMQPGRIYIDFRSLTLPPDLPSGQYALTLVVYRPWDNLRLTLADGVDHLLLETITLP